MAIGCIDLEELFRQQDAEMAMDPLDMEGFAADSELLIFEACPSVSAYLLDTHQLR